MQICAAEISEPEAPEAQETLEQRGVKREETVEPVIN